MSCRCTFAGCSGTGVAHCSPPCGGDICICVCGGEAECDGCGLCEESEALPRSASEEREELCPDCDQPMLPAGQVKRRNEYDHASGCPRGPLTTSQRVALAEADDGGYHATGAGRMKTARTLRVLGLVEMHRAGTWTPGAMVTLTPKGREVLYAMKPATLAPSDDTRKT